MEQCKKNKKKDTRSVKSTKEESLETFEDQLELLAEKIKKAGEKEIDLDDNEAGPLEELGKLQKKFCDYWTKLCKHAGCNPSMTGRSVEKKFKIRDGSLIDAHPDLVKKLEEYVNKHPPLYMPNFPEVRNIVLHEKHMILGEADIDVDAVANRLLNAIVNEAKRRRMRDLFDSIRNSNDASNDAADKDPLFLEKIKKNEVLNAEALAKLPAILDSLIQSQDKPGESEEDGESESDAHENADPSESETPPADIFRDDDDSDDDFKEARPAKKLRR